MIFVDTTLTSHCHANTGIQRVTRRLVRELGRDAIPVVHDIYAHYWRNTDSNEQELVNYSSHRASSRKRGATWSMAQKWRGRLVSIGVLPQQPVGRPTALIVPEVFSAPRDQAAFDDFRMKFGAPIIGVFHDLIPLILPVRTPVKTVETFEVYLESLRSFDVVAAVSEFSRDALLDYWSKRGAAHPPVVAIPLGVDVPAGPCPVPLAVTGRRIAILCVGTLEGRKNHLALLHAAESLWTSGLDFELTLFGGLNRETGMDAEMLAMDLIRKGYPLRRIRGGSDDQMEAEYARADFTVYPSLMEGFGLPVWESLARGRPCVCSGENAMAETTRFGGCLTTGNPTTSALADALRTLIQNPQKLAVLREECLRLKIRTWSDYTEDLRALISTLRA